MLFRSGVGLASSARIAANGAVTIPALHDAANNAPLAYSPVCGRASGIPVCLNPAYGRWLSDVTAALTPVLAEVAGLPGAPVRGIQVAAAYPSGPNGEPPQPISLGGQPKVLRLSLGLLDTPGPCGFCRGPVGTRQYEDQIRLLFAHAFVGAGSGSGSAVQQAVQAALLQGGGIPFAAQPAVIAGTENFQGPGRGSPLEPVYAAARRLAALPSAAQRAWLAGHLAALRAGRLTLADLP